MGQKYSKAMQAEMDSGWSPDDDDDVGDLGPAPMVPGPLPEYFSCLDNGSSQTLRCKKCGKGYKVPSGSVHPGNRIALMNHVRTHSDLEEL